MALKLYHFEACPYCEKVRGTLRRMDLRYESVEIDPSDRAAVKAVSGQELTPLFDAWLRAPALPDLHEWLP